MTKYKLFVQKEYDRSVGFYDSFGISVFENEILTRIIKGLSYDRSAVEQLVSAFNENELDPGHLNQAIEDFLYDFKG